jgi:(1->4)-alpha-D-glucan 1-alpha-D-glucosylmutase
VLSHVPSLWNELVGKWMRASPPPDAGTGLFLWQIAFGTWPVEGPVTNELRSRLHAYAEKAIREAALHTSWNDQDEKFEAAVHAWLDDVIDGPGGVEMTSLVSQLDAHAQSDSQAQKLLSLTVPGIPDVYQGTELWDDSLVDPDNRRAIDYAARRQALAASTDAKMRIVTGALHSRAERPETYLAGGYEPVLASGTAAKHLIAFLRGDDVLVGVQRWTIGLAETGWNDTSLPLPDGTWVDRLTGRSFSGQAGATELFTDLPVTLLERSIA